MTLHPVRWHVGEGDPTTVETITVRQDIGGPYPIHKDATLDLMSDGTVRWREVTVDGHPVASLAPAEPVHGVTETLHAAARADSLRDRPEAALFVGDVADARTMPAVRNSPSCLPLDGRSVAVADYPDLARLLGDRFGTRPPGEFVLPDMRPTPDADTPFYVKARETREVPQ